MKDLKNKVVIVTGASSGIGEAMAREFAAQGARVVLGARSVQKLQLIAGDIRSRGGQAAYCGVDVTDVGECRELIDTAVREFGGIDVLVCNAGLSMRAIFDDVDLEVLHRLMDVNFWGTVNCCKFALPYLQQSHGSIVGISSVAGLHGLPGRTGVPKSCSYPAQSSASSSSTSVLMNWWSAVLRIDAHLHNGKHRSGVVLGGFERSPHISGSRFKPFDGFLDGGAEHRLRHVFRAVKNIRDVDAKLPVARHGAFRRG